MAEDGASFVVFANLCAVNSLTKADFELTMV